MNGSICKNLFSLPIDRNMKPYYEQIQVVAAIETVIVGHTSISVVLNPFYTLTSSKPIDFNPFPWFHIELLTVSVHSIHISVHGIPIQSVVTWFLLSRRMVHSWEIMFFFSPGNSNHQSWELPRTAQDCHLIIIIYFLINHLQYYRACSTRNVELHEKKWNLKTNKTKEVTNTNVYLISVYLFNLAVERLKFWELFHLVVEFSDL